MVKQIMSLLYRYIVESVMSLCILSLFALSKISKIAKRIGVKSSRINELYQNDCINMAEKILKDSDHPLN